jgi:hypothetical protein
MRTARLFTAAVLGVATLMSCGGDDAAAPTTTASTTSTVVTTTVSTTSTASPTSTVGRTDVVAVWPAADVVFHEPQDAAADFVASVLGVPPVLGPFEQGDARSGEIAVLSPGEDGATPVPRGTLLLRRLGPEDGWFVLAAVNEHASIHEPASLAEVPAGPLRVAGAARGFEANVVASAFVAGRPGEPLDRVVTMGGPFEAAEPFVVTLDLTGAAPGDVVAILVRGGTGLSSDPGEFGAIPVVIAG